MNRHGQRSPATRRVEVDTPIRAVDRPWADEATTGEAFVLPPGAAQPVRLLPPARLVWASAPEWTTPRRVAERLLGRGGIRPEDVPAAEFPALVALQAEALVEIGLLEIRGEGS